MNQNNIDAEWHKLCNEYSQARDAQFEAFLIVTKKFAPNAIDPSEKELSEFEKTSQILENVIQRMRQFARENS